MTRIAILFLIASIFLMLGGQFSLGQSQHFDSRQPASVESTFAHDILAAHNAVRARLGISPLTWSNSLAQYAQEWANYLVAKHTFHPRSHRRYGENLLEIVAPSSNSKISPSQVVSAWAAEARNYNHQTNSCSATCGHYTQVVWRDSKMLGCAVASSGNREVWVCNYDPPGNVVGEKPY